MEMSEKELKQILLAHNRWLESGHGEPGDLSSVFCYAPRLAGARLDRMQLSGASFPVADLRYACLMRSCCQGLVIRGCQAYQSSLNRSDFSQADLCRGRFVEALGRWTTFAGADMRFSIWTRADLRQADLRGVNLVEGDLSGADLRGADLRGADMRGAELVETDFRGCDLSQTHLEDAVTWGAQMDEFTKS